MPYWLGRCHLTAILKQFLILRHEKGAEVMSMYKWPYIVRVSILLICSRCEGYLLDCSDTPCIAKPCDINSIVQRPYNVSQCYGYFCILLLWWEFFMWTPLKLSETFINPRFRPLLLKLLNIFCECHFCETFFQFLRWQPCWDRRMKGPLDTTVDPGYLGSQDVEPMHIQKRMRWGRILVYLAVGMWILGMMNNIGSLNVYSFPGVVHNIWKCRPGEGRFKGC